MLPYEMALYNREVCELLVNYPAQSLYFTEGGNNFMARAKARKTRDLPAGLGLYDLHSLGQYIQDGFNGYFFRNHDFRRTSRERTSGSTRSKELDGLNFLSGKEFRDQLMAELERFGTHRRRVRNIRITIPSVNENLDN